MKYKGYSIVRSPSYQVTRPNGSPLPDAQDIEEAKWLIEDDLKKCLLFKASAKEGRK